MHLTLHLTDRCNLRCRYCYASTAAGGDMQMTTVQAAIALGLQQLDARRPGGRLGIVFFGGEPLLRRDLIAATVRHCRTLERDSGQRFHFKMTTNGLLLDEAFFSDPDTEPVFVALSHDGIRAAHDTQRLDATGRGSFDALDRNVDLLLAHHPCAPAMMVVTPETVAHYAESVAYLFERGFRYLVPTLDYSADWLPRHLRQLRRQYRALADWYFRTTLAEEKFFFTPFEMKIASHVKPESCQADRCELATHQISVVPNGRIFPCVQFVGDGSANPWCMGDVQRGIDPQAQRRIAALRSTEEQTCIDCAVRHRCNHHCGCINHQATGSVDRVAPLLCAHERMLLPIADRLAEQLYARRNSLFIHKHYNDFYPLISLVEDGV